MKKIVALILAVMLLSTACFASASACSLFAKKDNSVAVNVIVSVANKLIDTTVKIAQVTKKDDGAKAKVATDIIAGTTKFVSGLLGAEVGCEYNDKTIDGNSYSIDPLIVINPHVVKK